MSKISDDDDAFANVRVLGLVENVAGWLDRNAVARTDLVWSTRISAAPPLLFRDTLFS